MVTDALDDGDRPGVAHAFYEKAAAAPGTPWYRLAHEAREALRTIDAETLSQRLDELDFGVRVRLPAIDPSRPSFWAGFVVLGDGGTGRGGRSAP